MGLRLVEEGRLTLVDPVAKHLPAFAGVKVRTTDGSLVDPIRPMTVGDLLAHTSGLTYHFLGDSPVSKMYDDALVQRAEVPLAEAVGANAVVTARAAASVRQLAASYPESALALALM